MGPPFEVLKNHGIKTYSYSGLFVHSMSPKSVFFIDTKLAYFTRSKFWSEYKETPVNEKMKQKVKEFFDSRTKCSAVDLKICFDGKKINSFKTIKSKEYKYHVAMFPHVIFDGNIPDRHIVFKDYLDWMISTINYFKNRNDIKLYIKSHPAELIFCKTTPKVLEILNKYVDLKSMKNIVTIPPEKTINTYEFLKSGIDLGLVYDNFLAVEMPYLKIPSITCIKGGSFTVKDGNFTIANREEYFNYLDNIENIIEEFHSNYESKYHKNIIRYIYWYLYENKFNLPIILYQNDNLSYNLFALKKTDFNLDNVLLKFFN